MLLVNRTTEVPAVNDKAWENLKKLFPTAFDIENPKPIIIKYPKGTSTMNRTEKNNMIEMKPIARALSLVAQNVVLPFNKNVTAEVCFTNKIPKFNTRTNAYDVPSKVMTFGDRESLDMQIPDHRELFAFLYYFSNQIANGELAKQNPDIVNLNNRPVFVIEDLQSENKDMLNDKSKKALRIVVINALNDELARSLHKSLLGSIDIVDKSLEEIKSDILLRIESGEKYVKACDEWLDLNNMTAFNGLAKENVSETVSAANEKAATENLIYRAVVTNVIFWDSEANSAAFLSTDNKPIFISATSMNIDEIMACFVVQEGDNQKTKTAKEEKLAQLKAAVK